MRIDEVKIIFAGMLMAALVALGAAPCQVEVRQNTKSPWKAYGAVTIDAIPGFTAKADPELDEYGGWKGTNVGNADGFFRVKKIKGRWWFVDPAGNLFLSKGMTSFNPGWSDRQKRNLKEKYGTLGKWAESEIAFLKTQGFNSLGCWSQVGAFVKNPKARIPYVVYLPAMLTYYGQAKKRPEMKDMPRDFPCVFDPEFEVVAEKVISQAANYAKDPYLMGYFVDNELNWSRSTLWLYLDKLPKDHPGCKAAHAWLDARKGKKNATMKDVTDADRFAFLAYGLDVYLGKVTKILRKYDQNHLFLGCRFNSWKSQLGNAEFFKIAGKYIDVISINHYGRWQPDQQVMKNWEKWSGKPFMVTEFYVKGEDSGLGNTTGAGWNVKTQNDRGIFYENFCGQLLKSGACVGWQWFKYMDNDPENKKADPSNRDSNKGIVAWNFQRYDALLRHMKHFNDSTYSLAIFWR